MTNEFDKDKVLGRVKKMMALANDAAASEGERDNALRMAHATLAKYNLTIGEAEASGQKSDEPRESGKMEGKDYPWMRTVAAAIARLFFCNYFYVSQRGSKVNHFFVGKQSNIVTAQGMTKYIIASIDKEARKEAKAQAGESGAGTYWRSFCKGAAHKVFRRCVEIQEAAERAPAVPGTSLVLASLYRSELDANAAFINEQMGIKLRSTANRERNTAWSAYNSGREFGGRIGLNNQISGSTGGSSKLLK